MYEIFPVELAHVLYLSLSPVLKVRVEQDQQLCQLAFTWISMARIKFQVLCKVPFSAESVMKSVGFIQIQLDSYVFLWLLSPSFSCLLGSVFLHPQGTSLWCEMVCPILIDLLDRWQKTGSGFPRSTWKKLLDVGLTLGRDGHQ